MTIQACDTAAALILLMLPQVLPEGTVLSLQGLHAYSILPAARSVQRIRQALERH